MQRIFSLNGSSSLYLINRDPQTFTTNSKILTLPIKAQFPHLLHLSCSMHIINISQVDFMFPAVTLGELFPRYKTTPGSCPLRVLSLLITHQGRPAWPTAVMHICVHSRLIRIECLYSICMSENESITHTETHLYIPSPSHMCGKVFNIHPAAHKLMYLLYILCTHIYTLLFRISIRLLHPVLAYHPARSGDEMPAGVTGGRWILCLWSKRGKRGLQEGGKHRGGRLGNINGGIKWWWQQKMAAHSNEVLMDLVAVCEGEERR